MRILASLIVGACLGALVLPSGPALAARGKKARGVDRVALARVLLRDGLPERALHVLDAPPEDGEVVDAAEFHRVRGLVATELRRFPEAARAFEAAIQHGEKTPPTYFALANALLGAERHQEALKVLREAPPELEQNPARFRLEANIHYLTKAPHAAFDAIERGLARFPEDEPLARQRLLLLLELGLYTEAIESSLQRFSGGQAGEKDCLALGEALLRAGRTERALALLEDGVLRWPASAGLRKLLAKGYVEAGAPGSAVKVLLPLTVEDAEAALLAAELYRRAGRPKEALHMNAEVLDQSAKMRQRLSLLLDEERFDEASLLEARLDRMGLLADDQVVYALAYAAHYAGRPDQAERLLGRLTDPAWFEKGNAIRRAMDACRRDPALCD